MHIFATEHITPQKICSYLKEHSGQVFKIEWNSGANLFTVSWESDMSESEFHMEVLHSFEVAHLHGELTMEERNAIDYAIGAIKTLQDMGVIK